MDNTIILILVATGMFAIIGGITLISHIYNLNEIKSKTVGDGQHGTARFSTKGEAPSVDLIGGGTVYHRADRLCRDF